MSRLKKYYNGNWIYADEVLPNSMTSEDISYSSSTEYSNNTIGKEVNTKITNPPNGTEGQVLTLGLNNNIVWADAGSGNANIYVGPSTEIAEVPDDALWIVTDDDTVGDIKISDVTNLQTSLNDKQNKVTYSNTQPLNPSDGDLWINPSDTTHDTINIEDVNNLQTTLNSKINEPSSEGTNGQVLTTDGNGGRTWTNASGSTYTANEPISIEDNEISLLYDDDTLKIDSSGVLSAINPYVDTGEAGTELILKPYTSSYSQIVDLELGSTVMVDENPNEGQQTWVEYKLVQKLTGKVVITRNTSSYYSECGGSYYGGSSWNSWLSSEAEGGFLALFKSGVKEWFTTNTIYSGYAPQSSMNKKSYIPSRGELQNWYANNYITDSSTASCWSRDQWDSYWYYYVNFDGGSDRDKYGSHWVRPCICLVNEAEVDTNANNRLQSKHQDIYAGTVDVIRDESNLYKIKDQDARTLISEKYTKPSSGIPASDIASGVIPDISGKMDNPTSSTPQGYVPKSNGDGTVTWGESGSSTASGVSYDNTESELTATNVQDAIDELNDDNNKSTVLTSWDVMPSNPKVGDIATNVNDSSYSALVVQDRTLSFNGGVQVLNRELIL